MAKKVLTHNYERQIDHSQRIAFDLIENAKRTFFLLGMTFTNTSREFWKNDRATPQQISDKLGTDAAEIFELHAKLAAFLADLDPDSIVEGMSMVGNFVINQDGTVTITP